MIKHISLALVSILCLNACTDFDEGGVYGGVAVDDTAITFESDGGNKTLSIHSGELWSLASIPDWLSIKGVSDSGTNDWIVRLEAEKNTSYDRSGTLSFSSKTRIASVTVSQKGVKGTYVAVESVQLSKVSLTLIEGKGEELTATVLPSTASVKTVSWESDDEAVASVSSTGIVLAKKCGTALITVKTDEGAKTATCAVTVKEYSDGEENGHRYVDLGLPSGIKWSTCNVGASTPEEYGDYFAWGETESKSVYNWSTYKYGSPSTSLTKYNYYSYYGTVDNKTTLEPTDDAAKANWGGTWRMPTLTEQDELRDNCTWTWITTGDLNGYKVTSNKNGNSIFLPAAGSRLGSSSGSAGTTGHYWSSSLSSNNVPYAHNLYFNSSDVIRYTTYRYYGLPVRPVTDKGVRKSVTSITLDQTSLTLEIDQTATLNATVLPTNATQPEIIWSSTNTSVATVDYTGKVTAVSSGSAQIKATTYDGGKTATCSVTVKSKTIPVTGVSLNEPSLSMTEGDTYTLAATVTPSAATDKSVTWSSNNTSVATVSSSGVVTAKAAGNATITVTTIDGGKTATCEVTVKAYSDGEENGYEYVDLGLPSGIKWATCNVGASKPEGYGAYFSWGEITTKSDYSSKTYKYGSSSISFTKYNVDSSRGTVDNKTTLELSDDAARVNWGGNWRMPTKAEQNELLNNCTWTWITYYGINGYRVTSKKNGKSIFLPAAGFFEGTSCGYIGTNGGYWSSSLDTEASYGACYLYIKSTGVILGYYDGRSRSHGRSIRPVTDKGVRKSVTSITLDKTSLTLEIGQTSAINATVLPADATQPEVIWSSTNTSVATVDYTGKVTAVSYGSAQIKATTYDGGLEATCSVVVKAISGGIENGHEYVNLGLSVKWATCNVGASSPSDYGSYFAWGETSTKSNYSWSTYKYGKSSTSLTKYNTSSSSGTVDNKKTLELSDDVARVNWGGTWRMPTKSEQDELINNCTWAWIIQSGVNGYKVTSNINGNSIFLPAAGRRYDSSLLDIGSGGSYWSSSLYSDYPTSSFYIRFNSAEVDWFYDFRYVGRTVRPVTE